MLSGLVVKQQIILSNIQGSNPLANIYFKEKIDCMDKIRSIKI